MRLIDADALKGKLPNTYRNGFENCRECRLLEREEVNAYIDRMPTVDAVPVVRCGECRKYKMLSNDQTQVLCRGVWHEKSWYCAGGERKEDPRENQD